MPATSLTRLQQAFVLGAGLGTRLKRLTQSRPKPLVPLANRPLITAAFDHLAREAGVSHVIVNTHHLADQYARFFPSPEYQPAGGESLFGQAATALPPLRLTFRHEPELLETGGGIRNIEDLLETDDFILYNGDICATLPLQPAIREHFDSGREVTLILRTHGGPLHVAFDAEGTRDGYSTGRVGDIRGLHAERPGTHLFTGIYLLHSRFLRRLPGGRASIIPTFLAMLREGVEIGAITIDDGLWLDLGTRDQYLTAHRILAETKGGAPWIHPEAQIAPDAIITGASAIGAGSRIRPGATLHDTVLWENAEVGPGSHLIRCIVTDRQHIAGSHVDLDL